VAPASVSASTEKNPRPQIGRKKGLGIGLGFTHATAGLAVEMAAEAALAAAAEKICHIVSVVGECGALADSAQLPYGG
jgi:hypothetical protein